MTIMLSSFNVRRPSSGRHVWPMALAVIASAVISLAFTGKVTDAQASTAQSLRVVSLGYGDYVYNYDFTAPQVNYRGVDWPVSLLFYNNASINSVKSRFGGLFGYFLAGSKEHAYVNDGQGYVWDEDGGRKNGTPSLFGSTNHYRVYAPPTTDRFYNLSFGYYVIGTSHIDHNELQSFVGGGDYYDGTETTEHDIGNRAAAMGLQTNFDYANFSNRQYGKQGKHNFQNDGRVTYIKF